MDSKQEYRYFMIPCRKIRRMTNNDVFKKLPNYRECGNQILRNFLNGLVIYLRGTKENPKRPGDVLSQKKSISKKGASNTGKPSFRQLQQKKAEPGLSSVKYKNKKRS